MPVPNRKVARLDKSSVRFGSRALLDVPVGLSADGVDVIDLLQRATAST